MLALGLCHDASRIRGLNQRDSMMQRVRRQEGKKETEMDDGYQKDRDMGDGRSVLSDCKQKKTARVP